MLNEKALCKLMRSTFKAGGVQVYRSESLLFLDGGWWAAGFVWRDAPGGVLALLTEWLRKLPEPDEGWHCIDGMPADEFDTLGGPGESIRAVLDEHTEEIGNLMLTPVSCGTARLAATDTGRQAWFSGDAVGVLGTTASAGGTLLAPPDDSRWGRWIDLENMSTVWLPATLRDVDPGVADILAGYDFWKGEAR